MHDEHAPIDIEHPVLGDAARGVDLGLAAEVVAEVTPVSITRLAPEGYSSRPATGAMSGSGSVMSLPTSSGTWTLSASPAAAATGPASAVSLRIASPDRIATFDARKGATQLSAGAGRRRPASG